MAAGKDGLALFSSVTIAYEAKITDKKMKKRNKKQETATIEQQNTKLN